MSPGALVRAVASLTSISLTTDAGSFEAVYDENLKRICLRSELLGGTPVRDEYTMGALGGFAIASTATILSKASKLLGESTGDKAMVKVRVRVDDNTSEYMFPLPLRTTTIQQMKTFLNEVQQAHAQTTARARERKSP